MMKKIELIREFIRNAEEAEAHVIRLNDYSEAYTSIQGIIERYCEASRVGVARLSEGEIVSKIGRSLEGRELVIVEKECSPDYVEALKNIDIGICGVDFGIAETGTLIVLAENICERLITITPKIQVTILNSRDIIDTFVGAFDKIYRALERGYSVSLITGPSKTGDIELRLVKGVHGPNEVYILLVGGEDGEGD